MTLESSFLLGQAAIGRFYLLARVKRHAFGERGSMPICAQEPIEPLSHQWLHDGDFVNLATSHFANPPQALCFLVHRNFIDDLEYSVRGVSSSLARLLALFLRCLFFGGFVLCLAGCVR